MLPLFVKRFVILSVLLAGYGMFFTSSAHDVFSWQFFVQHYTIIKDFIYSHKFLSYIGFCCAYVIAVAFSLPVASLLTLAGGAMLGWPAAVLVVGSATVGAGLVFLATRNLFTDMLRRRAKPFLSKLEDGFLKNAFFYLLALRLVPVVPFWAINIIPALTRMRFTHFLVATFIGITPGTCIYIWLGRGFELVLAANKTPNLEALVDTNILLPLAGLALLALAPVVVKRQQPYIQNKKNENETD